MDEKEIRFEAPEKLELNDLIEIRPNTEDFDEPNKAEALIKNLGLKVGDKIRQDGDYYTINPKMVLEGDTPKKYKQEIEEVKKILTEKEEKDISLYYRRKKENQKIRDELYYRITKRVEKIYNWDSENKKHIPKKKSKRSLEICNSLDWISDNNNLNGFNNIIYNLLSKDKNDWNECYKIAWKNKQIPNIQKWSEKIDGEYRVMTDLEADREAEDYLKDDPYLWQQAIECGMTTESLDEWVDWVISSDGRGSILNGYDGCEESEEVDGVYYYIYRNN